MKRAFYLLGLPAIGLMLLLPLLFGATSPKDYLGALAFISFGVSLLSLFLGFILLLVGIGAREVRPYAQVSLILGGAILLLSFTLCTSGAVRL